jgi:selenocysteine-specific elongation factor
LQSTNLNTEIIPLIIGTAGHVDHGKTFLVKNLTNFDTDRHPEEKQRGMSIDFAVAPYLTSSKKTVGIIDLPGHKDFIKNMTAGASSIDLLLLVVAADDGIMPQTIEHVKIAKYLGTSLILPVITKIDLVEESYLELIKEEIIALLKKEGLEYSDFSFVSNLNIESLANLKKLLDFQIDNYTLKDNLKNRAFRMFVRACFSQKGHGTIVTGVPFSGTVKCDETLELFSTKQNNKTLTTIKNIQNYRFETSKTEAKISSALNLRDVNLSYLERGAVLATPKVFSLTKSILIWIKDENKIKRGKTYTFHTGTLAEEAVAYPLSYQSENGTNTNLFNLRFKRAIVVAAGDKFIIRDDINLSGGIILSRNGFILRKGLRDLQVSYCSKAYELLEGKNDFFSSEILSSQYLILFDEDLISFSQKTPKDFNSAEIKNNPDHNQILTNIGKGIWINNAKKELFTKTLNSILQRYHREKPYSSGIQISHLLKQMRSTSKTITNFEEILVRNYLESLKIFKVSNGMVSLSSFKPPFSENESKIINLINKLLEEKLYAATGTLEEEHKIDKKLLEKIIKYLESTSEIKKIDNFLFKISYLEKIKLDLLNQFKDGFSLQEFREFTSLSRNVSVAILDYFDGNGFTKRLNEKRIILNSKI